MTAVQTAIISDYENNSATPEQIAESLELELSAVKATLLQYSSRFRDMLQIRPERSEVLKEQALGFAKDEPAFSKDELQEVLGAYKQLAMYSEHDHVRERALRNIINEAKGRNDVRKERVVQNGGTINIVTLNNLIVEARKKALQNAIDVGVVDAKLIECQTT